LLLPASLLPVFGIGDLVLRQAIFAAANGQADGGFPTLDGRQKQGEPA